MVLNNMYKNKYNTVQQICVGYDVWEVKWIFVDCIYYVCVCQMCNTMHFNKLQVFYQPITYDLLYFVGPVNYINEMSTAMYYFVKG